MARITSLAEEVFGDDAKAPRRLRKAKSRFEGSSPLEMLRTEAGARPVEEMLLQLDSDSPREFGVILWRVSNYQALDGVGGLYVSGRWHSKGHPVIDCTLNPAAALLEPLVHIEIDSEDRPERFQVLRMERRDSLSIEMVEAGSLSANWADDMSITQTIGDRWLGEGRSPLLQVPSVLAPEASTCRSTRSTPKPTA
jgi:RES domain-containing protein